MEPRTLALIPIGEPRGDLESIAVPVAGAFDARVVVGDPLPMPTLGFNRARGQWAAEPFVASVARAKERAWSHALGVTSVDLYTPDLNFVLGLADPARRVAVMSTARLGGEATLHATEAIHELGHTFGLRHCSDPRCVMWFSNTVEESKAKGTSFCARHRDELRRAR